MMAALQRYGSLVLLVAVVMALQHWWVQRQGAQIGAELAARVQPGDIHMLASDSCGICVTARRWFSAHGIPFSECSIERDAACRRDFQALRAPGTPVLLVRGQAHLGFSPERLRAAMLTPAR